MVTKKITIEATNKKTIKLHLVGTTPLILCKKCQSFEEQELFKQSHPKGTKLPARYDQPYNLFERLITSIHWENEIEKFDDYSLYTEEMWEELMRTNRPCILAKSFKDSLAEAFKSFGYKQSTKMDGTDLKRSLKIVNYKNPITFAKVGYDQHLAMTKALSRANVLTQQNVFEGWEMDLIVSHVDSVFPTNTIVNIFQNAGEFIGVGSRRGEEYGRYIIESVEFIG